MEKKLYRSKSDRMLAGICGGIGEYLQTDPTRVRLVWVTFSIGGPGLLVYLIGIAIIPSEP